MATGRLSKQTKGLQDLHRFLDEKSNKKDVVTELGAPNNILLI